jgi:hypothetical protein
MLIEFTLSPVIFSVSGVNSISETAIKLPDSILIMKCLVFPLFFISKSFHCSRVILSKPFYKDQPFVGTSMQIV